MTFRILFFLTFSMLFFTVLSSGQKSDLGNWFIYFGNQQINKKWNWWTEAQYRSYNFASDTEQILLRTAAGYNITPDDNIQLGYAFIHSRPYVTGSDEKTKNNEHRIYQQFIHKHSIGRLFVQHRYRFEERFLKDDFKIRFRYFLSLNIPFNRKVLEQNAFYLSGYNEIFLQTHTQVFDRNRLYGGLGYVLNQNIRLETGIMYQLYETSYRPQWQVICIGNLVL